MPTTADMPPTIIGPNTGWGIPDVHELWRFRAVLVALVRRDFQVRYKQTLLGAAWVVLQPLTMALVFTITLGQVARLQPPAGISYGLFTLAALVVWQLFAHALSHTSNSLLFNESLISKVFFPRLLIPFASVAIGLLDFAISCGLLVVGLIYYRLVPSGSLFAAPLFLLLALLTAVGIGTFLAAVNVRYRDVRHMTPFVTMAWFFATPVAYPASLVPAKFHLLQSLNPMVTVVEGFRYALVRGPAPSNESVFISSTVAVAMFVLGLLYFRRVERDFADHI